MSAITAKELERVMTNYLCTHSKEEIQEDLDRITNKYTSEELKNREEVWTDIFGHLPDFDQRDLLIECDLCHDYFDLQQIRICENGVNVYCDKCL